MRLPLQSYQALLLRYLRPQWHRMLLLFLLLLTSVGLQLVNPQILRYFIDTALASSATSALLLAGLLFIGIALINQGASVWATYVSENIAWTATNTLRTDLIAHCLRLDMAFHKAHTPGELIERIDGDVDTLSNFFSQLTVHLLANTLLLLGVLALLFQIDWRVGLSVTAFALIALVVLLRIRSVAVSLWVKDRQMDADFFSFLGEQLVGTEDIRANGATLYVMRRFYLFLRRWLPIHRRASLAGYSMGMTTMTLFALGNALAFALGAYLWSQHTASIGTIYIIFYYTNLLTQPLEQIRAQLQNLQRAGAGIERVNELLHTTATIQDGVGTPLPAGALSVAFEQVSFSYTTDLAPLSLPSPELPALLLPLPANDAQRQDIVLHNLSFTLQEDHVLGVLGRTGSGKTTLARLLLRLYDAQAGTIRVGGVPVQEARLHDLRRHIGMVTQDVQLFHATVRDNLTFFDRTIPDERILAVLDDLGLTPWYRSLPEGLDTELGSDGEGLSAGEAQLLAFTRVFLANPGLIILDEASSRLDPATEQLIERAVSKLLAGRTGIVIAHRLGTIQRADEILILEHGCMLEHSEREVLASDTTSRFYHLLQTGLESHHYNDATASSSRIRGMEQAAQ